jgi:hypothetical protein
MTGERQPEDLVRAWVSSGPESASPEFIDRTLRPIPRMRQRRSSWIAVGASGAARPLLGLAGLAAVIAVVVGFGILGRFPAAGGLGPFSSPSPSVAPVRPTFELRMSGGAGSGTYTADPTTSLNQCTRANGSWRLLYAGGDPFVNLDLFVGAGAEQPDGAQRVAAEIYAGPGYVRFGPATTTVVISATTPDRTTCDDGAPVQVALTVVCPN